MESILVTGGAGIVGSQLIKKLLQDYPNTEIISLDNYSTGSRASHQPGAIYMEGNTWDISEIFQEHRFDKIFHLGESIGPQASFTDYETASQSILNGTSQVQIRNSNRSKPNLQPNTIKRREPKPLRLDESKTSRTDQTTKQMVWIRL